MKNGANANGMKPPFYKKKWALVLYLAALAGVLAWLLLGNGLVLRLSGRQGEVQGLAQLPAVAEAPAHFSVDKDQTGQDLLQSHMMLGWAVLEVPPAKQPLQPDVRDWHIDLIFVSEKASYRVPTGQSRRADVNAAMEDNPNVMFSYSYGFLADFPALGMKNGEYRLYLDVQQGATGSGLVETGLLYKKDGTGLHRMEAA